MSAPTVSVVIVTWNCRSFVQECLHSLRAQAHASLETIVVDNASTDGTPELVEEHFPEVTLIRGGGNLGFAKANNLGITRSRGRFVALINPDVRLLEGCLERALDRLESDDSIGIVGPAMVGRDGCVHRSAMRLPSLWNCLCDALALHRIFGAIPVTGGQMMADFAWATSRDVEVLNGWFWLVRRKALDAVGLLDERFFMYGEDVDWCKRFRDAGWRLVFESRSRAIHYGGGSSRQEPLRFFLELQRAKYLYWHKHHGRLACVGHSMIFVLHHGLRFAAYGARSLFKRGDEHLRHKRSCHARCLSPSFHRRLRTGAAVGQ